MKMTFLLILILLGTSSARAYIDPGTGVTFAAGFGAMVWGFIALGLGAIGLTFKKWKNWIVSLFKKRTP